MALIWQNYDTLYENLYLPKILYIITRLDRGGSAEAVLQWAERMKAEGHETKIITGRTIEPHTDLKKYSERTGVPVIILQSLHREIEPLSDLQAFFKLLKIIGNEKPDIVHTNSSKAGLLGRMAAWLNRVPAVIHSPHGHIFYGYYGKIKTGIFIILERLTAKITNKITILTQPGIDDHLKIKIAPKSKFVLLPAGIDLELYRIPQKSQDSIRQSLDIGEDDIVIGWVGRMVDIKNPKMFIETAKILNENKYKFVMVGDGPLANDCQRLVDKYGLSEQFVFTGHRNDVPDLLHAMDIYVLTSDNEGLGRSILEAQSAGIPVIATSVGGVPEIVKDHLNGILVPARDIAALAQSIRELAGDSSTIDKFKKEAEKNLSEYSLDNTVAALNSIYRDLLV